MKELPPAGETKTLRLNEVCVCVGPNVYPGVEKKKKHLLVKSE